MVEIRTPRSNALRRGLLAISACGAVAALVLASLWFEHRSRPPDFHPSSTEQPRLVVPTPVILDGAVTVNIAIEDVERREVRSNGIARAITAISGEAMYAAGDVLGTLDDEPLIAFVGDAPVTRDITPSSVGRDVRRVAVFLQQLGFSVGSDTDRVTSEMRSAIRGFNEAHGRAADGETLRSSALAWIGPTAPVRLRPAVSVGDPVAPGGTLFVGPVIAARATVAEPVENSTDGTVGTHLVGTFEGIEFDYEMGTGELDPGASLLLAERGTLFTVTLRAARPLEGRGVPLGALVLSGKGVCVAVDLTGTMVNVAVIASDTGVAILGDPVPNEVVANPWTLSERRDCP